MLPILQLLRALIPTIINRRQKTGRIAELRKYKEDALIVMVPFKEDQHDPKLLTDIWVFCRTFLSLGNLHHI